MFDFYWATVGQTTLEIENEVVTSSNCSNISNLSLYSFLHYQTFANPPPKTFPFLPGAKGTRSVPFCCWLMGRMPTDLLGIMVPLIFRVPKALMGWAMYWISWCIPKNCLVYLDVFSRKWTIWTFLIYAYELRCPDILQIAPGRWYRWYNIPEMAMKPWEFTGWTCKANMKVEYIPLPRRFCNLKDFIHMKPR